MELKDLKSDFDKDFSANQKSRENGADDLVFYWVTQWDDELLSNTPLQYRGQFDVLRKAGRQILSDLRANPIQPEFKPKDDAREGDAEILDGLYRAVDRKLTSQEAYNMAAQDAVICGNGAWELYTDYSTNRVGDRNQEIFRQFIPEANNTVFWDSNAKRLDKSDARRCTILNAYTREGFEELVDELNGYDVDDGDEESPEIERMERGASFSEPEGSFAFKWYDGKDTVYVATIYRRERVKDKIITFSDPFGDELMLRESQLEDIMDELIDSGHEVVAEKEITRWQVRKFICSGSDILNGEDGEIVPGEHIPVVPVYGERAIIEGCEHWEGITRLAKDPQRLRNFQLSYLADIVSRSPRRKPIYQAEQIAGFEFMYEENGPDNNYPYLLQNRYDKNGQALPIGVVSETPDAQIPNALAASIELTRQAIEDVANPGLPQDIADPDLSGKAVAALQNRIDQQAYIYQENMKFAKRRDAEIFASMAGEVYDAPRMVTVATESGQTKQVQLMSVMIDRQTGDPVVLNDLTNMEFDVYATIGASYSSQKEQTNDRLDRMYQSLPDGDPMKDVIMLTLVENTDGVNVKHIRDFARRRMILSGYKEPETEEELLLLKQSQEDQQPDANMVLAQAKMLEGQAAMLEGQAALAREQRQAQKDAADAQSDVIGNQIDAFDAETKRIKVQVDATKTGAEINYKRADTFNKELDNIQKRQSIVASQLRGRLGA